MDRIVEEVDRAKGKGNLYITLRNMKKNLGGEKEKR